MEGPLTNEQIEAAQYLAETNGQRWYPLLRDAAEKNTRNVSYPSMQQNSVRTHLPMSRSLQGEGVPWKCKQSPTRRPLRQKVRPESGCAEAALLSAYGDYGTGEPSSAVAELAVEYENLVLALVAGNSIGN